MTCFGVESATKYVWFWNNAEQKHFISYPGHVPGTKKPTLPIARLNA